MKFQKSSQAHNTIPDAKLQNSLLLRIFFSSTPRAETGKKEKEISSSTPEQIENDDDDDGAEEEEEEEEEGEKIK